MNIGIMLRTWSEKGGIGVYTRNIVPELLRLNTPHQFTLFYQDRAYLGQFAHCPHVTEKVVPGKSKIWWDQVAMVRECRHSQLDLLFHPKFTTPLFAPCPTVMVVHGADWFMPDQAIYYKWLDVRYIRAFMPQYIKKCARVISVSQLTTDNFYQKVSMPAGKMQTIYFAPARHFQRVFNHATLQAVKKKYNLPDQFILTLSKPNGDGRKNLGQIFASYARYCAEATAPQPLVVLGQDGHLFREKYNITGDMIHFTGWVDQADMPAFYTLATLFLYPSNLEAFPIPLTEAMACGTPIVTSNVNGLKEIAGNAGILVNPQDTAAIATAIAQVTSDSSLQQTLRAKGLARATHFSWDKCAQQTMGLLEEAANL